jgi:hypothetical protein
MACIASALGLHSIPADANLAVAALAAVLYARPELVDPGLGERLIDLVAGPALPDEVASRATGWLVCWSTGPFASRIWNRIRGLVSNDIPAGVSGRLLSIVRALVEWYPDLVNLSGILLLAEHPAFDKHKDVLFGECVERFIFNAPERFTTVDIDRIARAFGDLPQYRYGLHWLQQRRATTSDVRKAIHQRLGHSAFPARDTVARIFEDQPFTVLAVLNAGMGLGDDIVRLGPLLQGLLDADPALTVTLVTRRRFLYDNPRVTTIPIDDDQAIAATLANRPQGIIEFFQPDNLEVTFRIEAHEAVERHLAERRPPLVIKGDMGRRSAGRDSNRSPFLHQVVALEGDDIACARGLDRKTHDSIYDPTLRLLAELGLPSRTGQEAPLTASLLNGVPSRDAERTWNDLTAGWRHSRRPIALVNPFGGSSAVKGFWGQEALLAGDISGLVDEGYRVVLLPNGQAWGDVRATTAVTALLEPRIRAEVRVGPGPSEADEGCQLQLAERPDLKYADRIVRLFKYFASYADLVVTVEGWLAHVAYNLGRPFRLLAAAGSFCSDWYPGPRGPAQRLVCGFSPLAACGEVRSDVLGEANAPPLPHRPRKALLEIVLSELGNLDPSVAAGPLRQALTSPDPDVRAWAIMALGRLMPAAAHKPDLVAGLNDVCSRVVVGAAQALMGGEVDCAHELGPRYREMLQAHIDIGRQNWEAVSSVGPRVLPALMLATRSDAPAVRAGAKRLLLQLIAPFVRSGEPCRRSNSKY